MSNLWRLAHYFKTGRMLIPTEEMPREKLKEMYGLPSAEDLDAVEYEKEIARLTGGESVQETDEAI